MAGGRGYGAAMATAALGYGGEVGGDGSGGERERRGGRGRAWGRVGGETEGARRRRPYPHASSPARWVRRGRALFRPGSGEQGKGTLCGAGPARPARLTAGQGVGWWPCGWVGLPGPGGFPPFFVFFVISFSYLFSLSVLFSFRAFRHFIKWCLLHHNYQCNISQPSNIFALPFENLGCLSLIHILNLQ